jgi:hypothetical protein
MFRSSVLTAITVIATTSAVAQTYTRKQFKTWTDSEGNHFRRGASFNEGVMPLQAGTRCCVSNGCSVARAC